MITTTVPGLGTTPSLANPTGMDVLMDSLINVNLPATIVAFNNAAAEINATEADINANALIAVASQIGAANAESSALSSANLAAASANFKGAWSSLSGALNKPASVSHTSGTFWTLLNNLANVASSQPGVTADWVQIPSNNMPRISRTSNTIISATNVGAYIDVTSGTFTQTVTAVASLADGFWWIEGNSGTGIVTIDPNSSETINGATTLALYPGDAYLIQCNGSNLKAFRLNAVADSRVLVHTPNGYGSINTKIPRFTTTVYATGADITYADSATLGSSVTVNSPGLYEISLFNPNAIQAGVTVNSAELTTNIASITSTASLVFYIGANSGLGTRTVRLSVGDIVRPHCDGNARTGTFAVYFSVIKVSN